ncbi:MAG TPA: glycosyltransferase [Terriglobia bacterium]|nr:glycosyltransferase [Terriglobia bacterium]
MTPRVTVLMTVYNGLPYLREAIDSVLNQGFRDYEFLIVDDASTDQSVETIQSYSDGRIRLLKNPKNIGQNASLNKGLAEACGEFIVRLDQDDVCLPGRIERQIAFLSENPQIALVGTWAYSMDERSRKRSIWKWRVDDFGKLVGSLLLGRCAILHPSAAYRKQSVVGAGGYDGSFGIASDYALWIDLILAGERAAVIPQQLIMYRVHRGRQSTTKAHAQWEQMARAHEKFVRTLSGFPDVNVLASILRMESVVWTGSQTHQQIAVVLESIGYLLNRSASELRLRPDESRNLRRMVYRWLGPGVKLGVRVKHLPSLIFYSVVFVFSPLLVPGVRPVLTRVAEFMRFLRVLPERSIH